MGKQSTRTLYIRNLNRKLPIREVKRRLGLLISRYSRISRMKMSNRLGLLGQAFVLLEETPTDDVMDKLNGRFFLGNVISVNFAHSDMCIGRKRAAVTTRTLLVTNIPEALNKEDLENVFRDFIGMLGVRFIRVKGLAFVDFSSVGDASAAYLKLEDGCIRHGDDVMNVSPSA